jgi:predicted enzyme related to lactoylglutathione lyase
MHQRPGGGVVMLTNKSIMPILPVVDLPRARAFYEQRLGLLPEPEGITATGVVYRDRPPRYDLPGLKTDHHIAQIDGMLAAWFKDPDGNILCVHQQGARSH